MANINFVSAGSFNDVGPNGFNNFKPTSLQFGPDGRLYVAELNGQVTAFTVTVQNGEYIVVDQEELTLSGGGGVVRSIQNHTDRGEAINVGDPGAPNVIGDRQVTGMYVTGTAENPVIYISSSDPRQGLSKQDLNLDTNSGVLTRVTLNENGEWEAVDLIRGLPRSEENHSVNGITLSEDETKLYLAVGSNTNNGGLSTDFAYTAEYALSSTVLEIDLVDLNSRTPQLDPVGGQNGTPRLFVYDLPTLDDPTVENVTDGVGEDEFGLDEGGPWGGNDGFNQAILPADAPLRIYADGFRNNVDLIFTEDGRLYTIDNGSNGGAGGNPNYLNGEAINAIDDNGMGDDEPLLLIEEGGYYGHPVPVRSNQNLAWTVYNDAGDPDPSLPINTVPDISALVPDSVNIPDGFVIDPSKFTGDPARLTETGIRIQRRSNPEIAVFNYTGGSSNGLIEYTNNTAFEGLLEGALIFADFNGSIQAVNLNAEGTALEPLIDPDNGQEIGSGGLLQLVPAPTGEPIGKPLDVNVGPDGTIWIADFTQKEISVYAPSDTPPPPDFDADDDGILNVDDPFIRDVSNGGEAVLTPGQTLTWTFSANQTDLPGRGGYGGGLTGVMLDGSTDFEAFLASPSTFPNQSRKIDNVKTLTASGGGTTVIEFVSNGDPLGTSNSGEYLFHTGVTIDAMVDTFTVSWNIDNPTSAFTGPSQQIGGYIGTGDQSNYLKLVATQDPGGEIQILLEDEDVVVDSAFIQADDLFSVPNNQNILFELEINPTAGTATPTVTYGIGSGQTSTVSGTVISLAGTNVLDAIQGNYSVKDENNQDVTTGLALGLFSSNVGQPPESLQGITFKDIAIQAADPALSLTIAPATISENGGVATATVTRNTDNSTELIVNIISSDTTEATVPTTVTIPAGQDSVTFDVTAVDDAIVDETQTPTITVSATGFIDGTATVDVFNDDEPPALSLVISPSTLSEKAGVAAATITRTGDIGAAVTVS
ncbi:MAG: Calx-beta domain-containing protein, partial [Cyanobacteria bacterium J06636_16]